MSENARKYISDYCAKNNITVDALEKKAGITRDSIYAFLVERVADIKLGNAIKIADTLSISLDELAGKQAFLKKFIKRGPTNTPINTVLLRSIIKFILSYIEHDKLYKYNFRQFMYAISEIYEYSISNKLDEIYIDFAESLCKRLHLFR